MTDRPHAPTASRLRRARADGDIPVSAAAARAVGFIVGVALLPGVLAVLGLRAVDLWRRAVAEPGQYRSLMQQALWDVAGTLLPWLAAIATASLVATLLQTRGHFNAATLAPKAARANPWAALKQLTNVHHWAALLLALCGATVITCGALYYIAHHLQSIAHSAERPLAALPLALWLLERLLWGAMAVGLAVGLADWLLRQRAWRARQFMTHAEWLEDQRNTYGDPAVRRERQSRGRNLLL